MSKQLLQSNDGPKPQKIHRLFKRMEPHVNLQLKSYLIRCSHERHKGRRNAGLLLGKNTGQAERKSDFYWFCYSTSRIIPKKLLGVSGHALLFGFLFFVS